MKKRKIANAVMVAVICLIVAGAVLGVGALRGWFDRPEEASASLSEVRGLLRTGRVLRSVCFERCMRKQVLSWYHTATGES